MSADASAAPEWRGGWPTVLGAGLGMAAGVSVFATAFGFFIVPLQAEFGWSRSRMALVSLAVLASSLLMPLVGALVDRHGPRRYVLFGSIAFALCYVAFAAMPGSPAVFTLILLAIALVAAPATSPLVFTVPIVHRFARHRGAALGLGLSGSYLLVLALAPLLQRVITSSGWRAGFILLAVLSLALGAAATALIGRTPRPTPDAPSPERGEGDDTKDDATLRGAARDRRFWLLAIAMVGSNLPLGGMISQLQPLLADKGVAPAVAALLGSWYAGMVFIGRVGVGVLLDRLSPAAVGFVALLAPAAGYLLLLPPDAPQFAVAALALTAVGLAHGAEGDLLAFYGARYFGRRMFGTIVGTLGVTIGVSIALGGLLFAAVVDHTGSYSAPLIAGAAATTVAAFAVLICGTPEPPATAPAPSSP